MSINRQYKDRLFTFIFGNEANKEWMLSLYNAVNHTSYDDAESITISTIDNMLYMHMKNDVSFLLADMMNFYEQQSTYNPNMPIRLLIYAGMVYAKYIEEHAEFHRYSKTLQRIPTPRCVCFYNAQENQTEVEKLRFSDACEYHSYIEICVRMLNSNFGQNKALLEACQPLYDYSWFVRAIRANYTETGD